MKQSFSLIVVFFLLLSCNKIIPENQDNKFNDDINNINKIPYSIPEDTIEKEGISCGTISCDVRNYLKEKFGDGTKIEGLKLYQERLGALLDTYNNHYKLIISEELKTFTNDFYLEYFGCEGNVYECPYSLRKLSEDELNYIFYIFIPQMVIDEYVTKRNGTYEFAEDIIQAIKRKDFESNETKEERVQLYKKKLDNFINTINLDDFNKDKLLNNNEYFYEKILKPNTGLHDIIMKKSVEPAMIGLDWTQDGQLEGITLYTVEKFYELTTKLNFNKEIFIQKIQEIYGYNKEENILNSIKNDIYYKSEQLKNAYNLDEKMVSDRYLRYDELYIYSGENFENTFKKISGEGNEIDFYNGVGEIGSRVMLLFNLGYEEKYYFMPTRLKFYNNKNSFLTTNIFKIFKYADEHNYIPTNIIIN